MKHLILLAMLACPMGADVKPDPKLAGLRERWERAMREMDIPGAAVVAVRGDDVILLETLGLRDVQVKQPVTADTMFYIASCTKSFMAMTVLTLVEEGKLELDAPVKTYLPQFEFADKDMSATLTIRDLLSHAKGLDSGEITLGEAYTGEMNEQRYWRMMKNANARGEFQYTNLHYTLLGRVVEAVTGKSWKDYVEQRVCKPAGMNRTTAYASRMYGDKDVAIPTIYWDKKLIPAPQRKTDRTMHAAGGMGSTANDLACWMRLNLNGGAIDGKRILSEQLTRDMQTVHSRNERRQGMVPEMRDIGYGLGWETGMFHGKSFIRHGGGYVGTAAVVLMIPEEKIGVAVLVNTDGGGGPFTAIAAIDVLSKLMNVEQPDLLAQMQPRHASFRQRRAEQAAAATQPIGAEQLSLPPSAYVGKYSHDDFGTIQISNKFGSLQLQFGDLRPHLFATDGKDKFIATFSGGVMQGGRFEVDAGAVKTLIIRWDDSDQTRFTRQ